MLFSLYQLVTNYSHIERGNLYWWMATNNWTYGHVCGGIVLTNGWCGRVPYYGRHQPSQVLIGWTGNQHEQAMPSNPISHILSLFLLSSCLLSRPNFSWWLNVIRICTPKKPFHSSNWLWSVIYDNNRKELGHYESITENMHFKNQIIPIYNTLLIWWSGI